MSKTPTVSGVMVSDHLGFSDISPLSQIVTLEQLDFQITLPVSSYQGMINHTQYCT
jgi:hypothetical protein